MDRMRVFLFYPVVSIFIILILFFVYYRIFIFEREYNYTYEKSENHYGVEFYRFSGKNPPPIDITDNYTITDFNQVNKLLSVIGKDEVDESMTYKNYGKSIVWNNYKTKKLTMSVRTCKYDGYDSDRYTCIHRIKIIPNTRDKMINLSENNDDIIYLHQKDYGDKWPFSVIEGLLKCEGYKNVIFITMDRKKYGLNGQSMERGRYLDGRDIWVNKSHTRSVYWDFIQKGLQLCEN